MHTHALTHTHTRMHEHTHNVAHLSWRSSRRSSARVQSPAAASLSPSARWHAPRLAHTSGMASSSSSAREYAFSAPLHAGAHRLAMMWAWACTCVHARVCHASGGHFQGVDCSCCCLWVCSACKYGMGVLTSEGCRDLPPAGSCCCCRHSTWFHACTHIHADKHTSIHHPTHTHVHVGWRTAHGTWQHAQRTCTHAPAPVICLPVQRVTLVFEEHRLPVCHVLAVRQQLVVHQLGLVRAQLLLALCTARHTHTSTHRLACAMRVTHTRWPKQLRVCACTVYTLRFMVWAHPRACTGSHAKHRRHTTR